MHDIDHTRRAAKLATVAVLIGFLSACANPAVNESASGFSADKYSADLEECRGGSTLKVAINGLGGSLVGSAYGAFHGAYHGALAGDAPEGAMIGAIVGSVAGVVMGAYEPIQNLNEITERCLGAKGYELG